MDSTGAVGPVGREPTRGDHARGDRADGDPFCDAISRLGDPGDSAPLPADAFGDPPGDDVDPASPGPANPAPANPAGPGPVSPASPGPAGSGGPILDPGTRPARLAVGVVSAGRVGSVLGAALAAAGHHVVATSGLSRSSLHRAATLLPDVPLLPPDEVVRQADLVLLAVPDDVLPGLVRGLAAAGGFRPGQIVVHTSGAHGVARLDPAVEHGVLPLALHPVMTFTGRPEDLQRLTACPVGVTAAADDDVAWSVGEALVVEMRAEPVRVPESVRPLYHAALAHGANHLVTLVRDCVELLESAGIRPAERLVAPLLSAALDNALRHGDRALTGPVARGDVGTVRSHLRVLGRQAPDADPVYRALAERTAQRAARAGLIGEGAAADVVAALRERETR